MTMNTENKKGILRYGSAQWLILCESITYQNNQENRTFKQIEEV